MENLNRTSSVIGKSNAQLRAAAYVRMSTERQSYSIQHQLDAIHKYAAQQGLLIVRAYVDEGKSGLALNTRLGLQGLLRDVQSGAADFKAVVVYDVSRWGRFQDVDESAYYEFICRMAGVQIIYCAEPFLNDGSALSALLKGIKRTMSAEYSRELSVKVFNAQCRFVAMGYKAGGYAGYGLRRVAVSADGQSKRILLRNERKPLITDRVRYELGPDEEVQRVKLIYRWYIRDGLGHTDIAAKLNGQEVLNQFGKPWCPSDVKGILTNEKYMGDLVFNRHSHKLQRSYVNNPPELWLRCKGAIPAIVSARTFKRAQDQRLKRMRAPTDDEMLDLLRDLFAKCGKVSSRLIADEAGMPKWKMFAKRFGSLANACFIAGVPPTKTYKYWITKHSVTCIRKAVVTDAKRLAVEAGATVHDLRRNSTFRINDAFTVQVRVTKCTVDKRGLVRWRFSVSRGLADFIIAAKLDLSNAVVTDYYLIPVAELEVDTVVLRAEVPSVYGEYRYDDLPALFGIHHRHGSKG
jgi:DNA invertase Pin-like site-specific DNA recombinase